MKKLVLALALAMGLSSSVYAAWPMWDDFKAVGMEGGRVVDYSDARAVTTSEGQSYAMFFALVDNDRETFEDMLAYTAQYVTEEKPRYVMGIGSPDYILSAVENGIDLFDCVLATRMARNGGLFTDDGVIALKKAAYRFDHGPVQEGCGCTLCREYSRAYMHHLIKCNEMLGGMLATEHNLQYLYDLMNRVRQAIREDRFREFKEAYLRRFYAGKQG